MMIFVSFTTNGGEHALIHKFEVMRNLFIVNMFKEYDLQSGFFLMTCLKGELSVFLYINIKAVLLIKWIYIEERSAGLGLPLSGGV